MAEATTNQGSQPQNEEDELSGGTQPVGASRHIGKDAMMPWKTQDKPR